MKNFLLIILILASIGGVLWFKSKPKAQEKVEISPVLQEPDIINATFKFDGERITLKDGKASSEVTPDSAITLETTLTDDIKYGDINGDERNDAVGIALQSGGGSGMFVYLVALVSGNVEYKGLDAVFLGDRISPKSISISKSGVINIEYLDRLPDEPMAAEPTIVTSKNFKYSKGALEEI